jgi:redox-sensitive bicupin YhaK (pirin superfamily)
MDTTTLTPRRVTRIITVPPLAPGFVGPGHLAAMVVSPEEFARHDPFILLMDDHLDIGDRSVGGAHPHAGFETVTLVLDGAIYDRDEGGMIQAGEVQWMTAGRGIIHGEHVATIGKVRILQLWLTLPKAQRWTTPAFQDIHANAVPVRHEPGVTVRIYSGASGGHRSATRNHVPVTLIEAVLLPSAAFDQELPRSFNGFVFVIDGAVRLGPEEDARVVEAGQVAWLDRPDVDRPDPAGKVGAAADSVLRVTATEEGARVVLYAGQPQGDRIVSHGPFIGDTREDIARLYQEYRDGRFVRLSDLTHAAGATRAH